MKEPTALTDHFALDIVASALDGFVPPSEAFDPAGDWRHTYRVCTLTRNCDVAGEVVIARKALDRGGCTLTVEYHKRLAGGYRQEVTVEIDCLGDTFSTPLRWRYDAEMFTPSGDAVAHTRIAHTAVVGDGFLVINDSTDTRRIAMPEACTLHWALFDAVQRLPREPFDPAAFTLLDHLDEVKPGHVLSYRGAIDVLLGARKVQRHEYEELEKGRIRKTRWEEEGGEMARLHGYQDLGQGIVPRVYWVDKSGRLLFLVAGLEAYLWTPTEAAS